MAIGDARNSVNIFKIFPEIYPGNPRFVGAAGNLTASLILGLAVSVIDLGNRLIL
jgi:hypothetical protein